MVILTVEDWGQARSVPAAVITLPTSDQVRDAIERMSSDPLELHLEQGSGAVLSVAGVNGSYFLAFFDANDGPYFQALGPASGATTVMFIGGSVVEMSAPYLITADVALEVALAFLSDDCRPTNVMWEQLT